MGLCCDSFEDDAIESKKLSDSPHRRNEIGMQLPTTQVPDLGDVHSSQVFDLNYSYTFLLRLTCR